MTVGLRSRIAFALGLAVVLLLENGRAEACSPRSCWDEHLGVRGPFPANIEALVWRPASASTTTLTVSNDNVVLLDAAGVRIPVEVTPMLDVRYNYEREIRPLEPLLPDAQYSLTVPRLCDEGPPTTRYTLQTRATTPIPSSIGALRLVKQGFEEVRVSASGTCVEDVHAATAGVEVELSAEAEPWREVLLWETLVDGQRWFGPPASVMPRIGPIGESRVGAGRDLLYVRCSPKDAGSINSGLSPGLHRVVMQASLPGRPDVWNSSSLSLTLNCSDAIGELDFVDGEPGCGCSSTQTRRRAWTGLVLLALAWALGRGRPRHRITSKHAGPRQRLDLGLDLERRWEW